MTTTIKIPGGEAVLADPAHLPERRRRPAKTIASMLGDTYAQIAQATRVLGPDGTELDGPDADRQRAEQFAALQLTERDLDLLWRLNDANAWALLQSWTLDLPLPDSPDALQDLPGDVYDALLTAAGKVAAQDIVDQFSVAAVEDPASPTGASGA